MILWIVHQTIWVTIDSRWYFIKLIPRCDRGVTGFTNEPLSTQKMWSHQKKIYNENHLITLWLRNWDVILCAELVLRLEANTAKTQPNQLEHVNPTFCHSPTVEFLFNGHESLPGTIWVSPRNAQSKCQFNNVAWIRLETTLWDHHFFFKIFGWDSVKGAPEQVYRIYVARLGQ